jgi:hypothetical protein
MNIKGRVQSDISLSGHCYFFFLLLLCLKAIRYWVHWSRLVRRQIQKKQVIIHRWIFYREWNSNKCILIDIYRPILITLNNWLFTWEINKFLFFCLNSHIHWDNHPIIDQTPKSLMLWHSDGKLNFLLKWITWPSALIASCCFFLLFYFSPFVLRWPTARRRRKGEREREKK